jgi:hypothetical protein
MSLQAFAQGLVVLVDVPGVFGSTVALYTGSDRGNGPVV